MKQEQLALTFVPKELAWNFKAAFEGTRVAPVDVDRVGVHDGAPEASFVDWTALPLLGQSAMHMSCLVLASSHRSRFIHHDLRSVESTCKVTCTTCEIDNMLLAPSR